MKLLFAAIFSCILIPLHIFALPSCFYETQLVEIVNNSGKTLSNLQFVYQQNNGYAAVPAEQITHAL